jgi:quercetin dioxygenase-like cupin family protein
MRRAMSASHTVLKLWLRRSRGAAPEPCAALQLEPEGGVVGDHAFGRKRHVTIVFEDDWREAAREVGRDVDPVFRRANVLVTGGGGRRWIGARIMLGTSELEIGGITDPCPVMERGAAGLMEALRPRGRSGIWGRVLRRGVVRCSDRLHEGDSMSGIVKHADQVPAKDVAAGRATRSQVLLGPEDGVPHFAMRRFTLGAGGGMPRHRNTVEHEQYVLRGRARVGIGERVHEVGAGDVLYIPAGAPHFYEVVEAPFEFLCMVPHGEDRLELLDGEC